MKSFSFVKRTVVDNAAISIKKHTEVGVGGLGASFCCDGLDK